MCVVITFKRLTDWQRPWTVYVVRSKFVLICGQLLTRKTEISIFLSFLSAVDRKSVRIYCALRRLFTVSVSLYRGHISWFHLWRVDKRKLFSVSSLSKEPFRGHRSLGIPHLGMQLTSGGYAVEWNSAKWQSRLSNHVLFTSNRGNIWQFCFNGYLYQTYMWI